MLDQFFTRAATLERMRAGPWRDHIDAFTCELRERGYARSTGKEYLRAIDRLSRWCHRRRLGVHDLSKTWLMDFLRDWRGRSQGWRGDWAGLQRFLEYLRRVRVLPAMPATGDADAVGQVVGKFAQHLIQERGLKQTTVAARQRMIRWFLLERFGNGPIQLQTLSPGDVIGFVRRNVPAIGLASAKLLVYALRGFCRWLRLRGDVAADLAACVPTVPDRRFATLPKSLPTADVRRVLRACDRSSATGRRDYAILLLLARLGLRAGEVVALTLDDIDWRAGQITVRSKGGRQDPLPLPQDVGAALVAYLRRGRPACTERRVFVSSYAPRRGFAGPAAVDRIVRKALDQAGLTPPRHGAHLFRHTLATELLRRGASLSEIGEVLRHRHASTTQIYAKVDLAALHALAQPWPGGVR